MPLILSSFHWEDAQVSQHRALNSSARAYLSETMEMLKRLNFHLDEISYHKNEGHEDYILMCLSSHATVSILLIKKLC